MTAAALRADLDAIGWTTRELARRADCSPNTASDWVTGRREPPGPVLARVAELAALHRANPIPPWRTRTAS